LHKREPSIFVLRLILLSVLVLFSAGCGNKKSGILDKNNKDSRNGDIEVAFVYVGDISDAGWTFSHDQARIQLERDHPNVKTSYLELVKGGKDSKKVFRELAKEGNNVIIGTSYSYGDSMFDTAKLFPGVKFLHCSGNKISTNMGTYFGRMYQARYLTGLVAGNMTDTDKIGYVAAFPVPDVVRGINGFTLGVRKVNPKAKVFVVWTDTWYDPLKERKAAEYLLERGCDIIAQHQDSPTCQLTAQEFGKYCIGYNCDMSTFAPKAHLVSPIWRWGVYYDKLIKQIQNGTWRPTKYWGGLKEGIVDISEIGSMVPRHFREQVEQERKEIISGRTRIFEGPIKDNKGKVIYMMGECPDDNELWNMDYFVEGVVIKDKKEKKGGMEFNPPGGGKGKGKQSYHIFAGYDMVVQFE